MMRHNEQRATFRSIGERALERLENLQPDEFDHIWIQSGADQAKDQEDEAWRMYSYIYEKLFQEQYKRNPY